jgi:DNA-binding transcriptional regulator GbsR (MarR family)
MLEISALEMANISPMVRTREGEVSARLDHIELMRGESKAHSGKICRTVGEHSSLVNFIDVQVKTAAVTRQTLHLLSLNAIVEGDRLGAQASVVLEIGNGISDLTEDWGRITDQSDLAMRAISELVERINKLTANLSKTEDQKLEQAQAQARAGLKSLRTASEFAARQSRDIQFGLESMKIAAGGIVKSVDVLEASHRQIDGILSVLESVQSELATDSSETWDEREKEEMKQLFAASYTTEMEREVLRIALGGAPLPPAQPTLEGNGVELF